MLWYVYLMTISATAVLGWVALELLGRPIRALLNLRRNVLEQMLVLGNISLPSPRETAVSSREIHEYDQAMRNVRQAQGIFRDLGSQLLAFGENEPIAANAVASIGLNPVAAGSALIGLSMGYSRPDTDRAGLRNQIENALRLTGVGPAAAYQRRRFEAPVAAVIWLRFVAKLYRKVAAIRVPAIAALTVPQSRLRSPHLLKRQ